jgi:hypothetical protein
MKILPTPDKLSPDPLEEAIRKRAHELYENRGKQEGNELDDWLQAEREVLEIDTKGKAAYCFGLDHDVDLGMLRQDKSEHPAHYTGTAPFPRDLLWRMSL